MIKIDKTDTYLAAKEREMEIRIYLTDLAAYNEGRLFGEWLNLSEYDAESLQKKVDEVLTKGHKLCLKSGLCCCAKHEEYFITDSETDGLDLKIGEYDSPFELLKRVELLNEIDDEYDLKRISFCMNYLGDDLYAALGHYEDVDFYAEMSLRDLAYQFIEEGLFGEIPKAIENYLDYDAIAHELGYDYIETDEGCFRAD